MNDPRNGDHEKSAPEPHDADAAPGDDPAQETKAEEQSASPDETPHNTAPASAGASTYKETVDKETADKETAPTQASRGGGVVSWFAVLIALLALVLATQPHWPWQMPGFSGPNDTDSALTEFEAEVRRELQQSQRQQTAELRDASNRIEAQERAMQSLQAALDAEQPYAELESRLDTALAELQNRIGQFQGDRNSLESGMNARMEAMEARTQRQLEQMAVRLESVGEDLDDTDRNLSERLTLIQVEALLTLGRDRLELDGDAVGASLAWQRAAGRLQSLDGPAFEPLRQSIERERSLIDQYRADQTALSVDQRFNQLNRIAEQVQGWPLRSSSTEVDQPADEQYETTSEGWGARVGQALAGLVRIENVEQAGPSALEAEQARARIQSALRTAALASAQQDWALNRSLIEWAEEEIRAMLNSSNAAVERALEQLNELKAEPEPTPLPSLGESRGQVMRLLEQSQ